MLRLVSFNMDYYWQIKKPRIHYEVRIRANNVRVPTNTTIQRRMIASAPLLLTRTALLSPAFHPITTTSISWRMSSISHCICAVPSSPTIISYRRYVYVSEADGVLKALTDTVSFCQNHETFCHYLCFTPRSRPFGHGIDTALLVCGCD